MRLSASMRRNAIGGKSLATLSVLLTLKDQLEAVGFHQACVANRHQMQRTLKRSRPEVQEGIESAPPNTIDPSALRQALPTSTTLCKLSEGKCESSTPMLLLPSAANTIASMLRAGAPRPLHSVPYCERTEALKMLQRQFELGGIVNDRCPLVCNAGPPGSGKSTQMAANMKYAAERGIMPIDISFSVQRITPHENATLRSSERLIVNRILAHGQAVPWERLPVSFFDCVTQHDKIESAVAHVKSVVGHNGPVLLSVDAFRG